MSVLSAIRPDDWNFPLFVHVLSAMVLFGAVVLAALSVAGNSQAGLRLGFRALLVGAIPAWIAMRLSAQWIASKEGLLEEDVEAPAWVGVTCRAEPAPASTPASRSCTTATSSQRSTGRRYAAATSW